MLIHNFEADSFIGLSGQATILKLILWQSEANTNLGRTQTARELVLKWWLSHLIQWIEACLAQKNESSLKLICMKFRC